MIPKGQWRYEWGALIPFMAMLMCYFAANQAEEWWWRYGLVLLGAVFYVAFREVLDRSPRYRKRGYLRVYGVSVNGGAPTDHMYTLGHDAAMHALSTPGAELYKAHLTPWVGKDGLTPEGKKP